MNWIIQSCRLLAETARGFRRTRPFDGLTIGTAIHLEPKTAALLLTLMEGGARVVATGNLMTTQPETVAALRSRGVKVVGELTGDPETHESYLREVLDHGPDLILDNGGDLFARFVKAPYDSLLGGTEETTSGRERLLPLRDRINRPLLVINDSPIKQMAENEHAVGQSVLESFMRITNRATNGRRVTVIGYGACGRGVAGNFARAHARVSVLESDPVRRLNALFDGFAVPERDRAISSADVIVTVTGSPGVISADDIPLLTDGVILANAGHLPWEIDVAGLLKHPDVVSCTEPTEGVKSLALNDGKHINVLTDGHIVNLSGPRPLGNSAESMDLGFTLQARCLESIARGHVSLGDCVVPVPRDIDAQVARDYIALVNRQAGLPG
ncbi:adenosylhomocysteinase [Streptosporangium longisporum]